MNKILGSDEEEDLESLRLAALQSFKRKELQEAQQHNFRNKSARNKWGRFGPHQRGGKAGNFNRYRSPNLISITPVGSEPQNIPNDTNIEKEKCSKFDRANKSDKSESESEDNSDKPGNLKKSDSLEVLMQELDEEIQGPVEENPLEEVEPKLKDVDSQSEQTNKEIGSTNVSNTAGDSVTNKIGTEKFLGAPERKISFQKFHSNKSPKRMIPKKRRMYQNFPNNQHHPQLQPSMMFYPNYHFQPPMMPYMNPENNPPPFMQTNVHPPPLYFDRPISPLSINTESLTTATRAPLSPRSARFVLENKAIVEKRKRRSYSKSPSRSLSRSPPRYSPSPPRRFRGSVSPRRLSKSPRRGSPFRKRSLSPRRRSLSPRRGVSNFQLDKPAQNKPKPKPEIPQKVTAPKEKEPTKDEEEKTLDPVLLARKRKFESNEINKKEGIIRLRPKDENMAQEPKVESKSSDQVKEEDPSKEDEQDLERRLLEEDEDESEKKPTGGEDKPKEKVKVEMKKPEDPLEFLELEMLLNDEIALDDVIQPKVADIFSDEESDNDNEGRFKTKLKREKVPVLSFSKLINGAKQEIKKEALPDSLSNRRHIRDRDRDRFTRPTTSKKPSDSEPQRKTPPESHNRKPITIKYDKSPVESKIPSQIELKVKQPSEYKKSHRIKSTIEPVEDRSKNVLAEKFQEQESEDDLMENDSDSADEQTMLTEGDLRTQLSRKRAEKLHAAPPVSSRFLKFALQEVHKKSKKKSKKKSISDAEVPIHFRLGLNESIFQDTKMKKKRKKRKNRELMKQV